MCMPIFQVVVGVGCDLVFGDHVHEQLVLRSTRHGDCRGDLQIHRIPRVSFKDFFWPSLTKVLLDFAVPRKSGVTASEVWPCPLHVSAF